MSVSVKQALERAALTTAVSFLLSRDPDACVRLSFVFSLASLNLQRFGGLL